MDRNKDFKKFTVLMATLGEATGQEPSPQKIEIYFRCLSDMHFSEVESNALNQLRQSKFFPAISEIRQEADPELLAQEDCKLIESLCKEFIFPDFPRAGRTAVFLELQKQGKEDLMYLVDRWGAEIATGQNPTATRAQMVRGHTARIKNDLLLSTKEPKKIDKRAEKLIDEIIKA